MPGPFPEEGGGEVPGLGLNVLGQGDGDRAGVCGAGQGPHGLEQGGGELVRSVDPVPVLRNWLERVTGGRIPGEAGLQLLQDCAGPAAGEDVTGQTQHRQPVDRRGGCAGDHVGRPGADRGAAGNRAEAVLRLRVAGGHVHHALLIAGLVQPEVFAVLQQGLADARDVAVAEDADRATKERLGVAVALDALGGEELDDGLADREPLGGVGVGH